MKIKPQIPAAENSGTNRVKDSQSGPAKNLSTTPSIEPNDTVQLFFGHATIHQLVSQLNQVPDVRQDRVNALRSEIESGQFQRSIDQVAGAVVTQLLGVDPNG